MVHREIDLNNPSEEPPREATSEILWRLAVRVFREHERDEPGQPQAPARCVVCTQPWPCSGRRLAQLGLNQATV